MPRIKESAEKALQGGRSLPQGQGTSKRGNSRAEAEIAAIGALGGPIPTFAPFLAAAFANVLRFWPGFGQKRAGLMVVSQAGKRVDHEG